ncbi:hypothetical protein D1818_10545 [Aquimarina sp. BL5]|uniref:hypothetical protein n=1 Tax=Aquimarina sp. BL5 TaxID=1714860 RepID=UPI000E471642|nr:hypothetical protein [Aquimarina sp. BL5]AXT51243.1 hypothetical protein D1818_10545 [Aquimarina sp. BL5]RKN09454.1 hypothetical protein D7036_04065 [Aquimarina sp. BL5]
MKKALFFLILFGFVYSSPAQRNAIARDSISLGADHFLGLDSFGAVYYTKGNIFYKKWNNQEWQFGDFILGQLTQVSILNPLKIVLFYESSNTIVLVDKYLSEIDRINFNTIAEFKSVSLVSPANDNSVWVFDNNTQQLELFNTISNKTLITTQPITELPTKLHSNFNYCWILTSETLSQFNVYGSLLTRSGNDGYIDMRIINDDLLLLKEDGLYYHSTKTKEIEKINLPEIPIKQFYVTNEILYIYHQSKIYSFDLTPQKN